MGANAQTSVPTFTAGEVLTAANMNISARTGIPVFATSVTRDAAFGGTGEKTLAEGQFAYLEDSNTTQYYDGSAWQTVGITPGLVQIIPTSAAVTGSGATGSVGATGIVSFATATSVSFNGGFSATYDRYQILYNLTSSADGTDENLEIRFRASGTDETGANYQRSMIGIQGTTISLTTATGSTLILVSTGTGSTNGNVSFGIIDVIDPFATKITKISSNFYSQNNSGTQFSYRTNGAYDATTSFDGMTFIIAAAAGTVDITGTLAIYGFSK